MTQPQEATPVPNKGSTEDQAIHAGAIPFILEEVSRKVLVEVGGDEVIKEIAPGQEVVVRHPVIRL